MDVRGSLALLAIPAALAVGCSGERANRELAPLPAQLQRAVALEELVAAAAGGDTGRMWAVLSRSTRNRLGPTVEDFQAREAASLRRSLEDLSRGPHRVILNESVDLELGVVAIAGKRAAFAAPVRLEQGVWKVQLDHSLRIEPVRPQPMELVHRRTQLFAEVAAPASIDAAGIWFDGTAFSSRAFSDTDRTHMSVWGEAPQPLARGPHTVVAFASAGTAAGAVAWGFTVVEPGPGYEAPYGFGA